MNDIYYMSKAIELAECGNGKVLSNPLVGAVIVKDDKIIGSGYHKEFGSHHAEIEAINSSTESFEGATIYVTLEPCCHHGKTPACLDAIIFHKFSRVVIGMLDPNPIVAGKSVEKLLSLGIEVEVNVLEEECRKLNPFFIKHITTGLPFVIYKYAMTMDGKTATITKDSKWISNETSRERVHHLRNDVMAIMVGSDTVVYDDPHLTTRAKDFIDPIKIIVDSKLKTKVDSNVYSKGRTIVAIGKNFDKEKFEILSKKNVEFIEFDTEQIDLKLLMKKIGEMGINSILLEGGSTLASIAFTEKIVDQVHAYIAPKIFGGENAPTPIGGLGVSNVSDSYNLKNIEIDNIDGDVFIKGDVCSQE